MVRDEKGRFVKGHKFLGDLSKPNYFKEGITPWNKGTKGVIVAWNKDKKMSKEHCENLSKAYMGLPNSRKREWNRICEYCKKEYNNSNDRGDRKYCSLECSSKSKIGIRVLGGEKRSGALNYNWKGGITRLNTKIRRLPEMKEWRVMIFGRDNFTCQTCNDRGCYLEAHHLIPLFQLCEENKITNIKEARQCSVLWDINNGVTLCKKCHNKTKGVRYVLNFNCNN